MWDVRGQWNGGRLKSIPPCVHTAGGTLCGIWRAHTSRWPQCVGGSKHTSCRHSLALCCPDQLSALIIRPLKPCKPPNLINVVGVLELMTGIGFQWHNQPGLKKAGSVPRLACSTELPAHLEFAIANTQHEPTFAAPKCRQRFA
jgi:hypothetical protein